MDGILDDDSTNGSISSGVASSEMASKQAALSSATASSGTSSVGQHACSADNMQAFHVGRTVAGVDASHRVSVLEGSEQQVPTPPRASTPPAARTKACLPNNGHVSSMRAVSAAEKAEACKGQTPPPNRTRAARTVPPRKTKQDEGCRKRSMRCTTPPPSLPSPARRSARVKCTPTSEEMWRLDAMEDNPGMYLITQAVGVFPAADNLHEGDITAFLHAGEVVDVVDVVVCVREGRIRGRIGNPTGWITLMHLPDCFRWAEPLNQNGTKNQGLSVATA